MPDKVYVTTRVRKHVQLATEDEAEEVLLSASVGVILPAELPSLRELRAAGDSRVKDVRIFELTVDDHGTAAITAELAD